MAQKLSDVISFKFSHYCTSLPNPLNLSDHFNREIYGKQTADKDCHSRSRSI